MRKEGNGEKALKSQKARKAFEANKCGSRETDLSRFLMLPSPCKIRKRVIYAKAIGKQLPLRIFLFKEFSEK